MVVLVIRPETKDSMVGDDIPLWKQANIREEMGLNEPPIALVVAGAVVVLGVMALMWLFGLW
jgi:hypothetical protein